MTYEEIQNKLNKDYKWYMQLRNKTNAEKNSELETIVNEINWLLHDSRLTQKEIAEESGVSLSTINRVKVGRQEVITMRGDLINKLHIFYNKLRNNL